MRLSYSAIETYESCPLKYKYRHIERVPEQKSKEAVFGTIIHTVMKQIHEPGILHPTLEEALDFFSKQWNEDVFANELEERAAFTQGVQMIQRYYADNDPAAVTVVDLESRFSIDIGDDATGRHTVSGTIDRIDRTADGFEIIDYKTGRKAPSQEKVDQNLQLTIYLKAFLERYPKERENLEKITVSLYYLPHGMKISSHRTQEDLARLDERFAQVVADITGGHFEPILSPLCDWCPFQEICPLWKHKFAETRKYETAEVRDAIKEYLALTRQMSSQKARLAELKDLLFAYLKQEGVERMFDEQGIIAKSIRKTYGYDIGRLRAILEPLDKWNEVIKVDATALKRILPSLPSPTKRLIEETKELERETESLSVKKGKVETGIEGISD